MINAGRFQPDLRRIRRINEYGIFFRKRFLNRKITLKKISATDSDRRFEKFYELPCILKYLPP